ncbi:MAG: hypothetical protein ABSH40_20305 [Bryobacteraceae bacterium]
MSHYYALLSMVYMISFVLLYDRVRLKKCDARFVENCLLKAQDIGRLQSILAACQES